MKKRRHLAALHDALKNQWLQGATRFSSALIEAVNSLKGSVELRLPEPAIVAGIELRPNIMQKAAQDATIMAHLNEVLVDWCKQVEVLLDEASGTAKDGAEAGGFSSGCLSAVVVEGRPVQHEHACWHLTATGHKSGMLCLLPVKSLAAAYQSVSSQAVLHTRLHDTMAMPFCRP